MGCKSARVCGDIGRSTCRRRSDLISLSSKDILQSKYPAMQRMTIDYRVLVFKSNSRSVGLLVGRNAW